MRTDRELQEIQVRNSTGGACRQSLL